MRQCVRRSMAGEHARRTAPADRRRVPAVLLAFAVLVAASGASAGILRGDANCDGVVDGRDLQVLQAALFGGNNGCAGLDVNDDGSVGAADLSALQRLLVSAVPTATATGALPPDTPTATAIPTGDATPTAT